MDLSKSPLAVKPTTSVNAVDLTQSSPGPDGQALCSQAERQPEYTFEQTEEGKRFSSFSLPQLALETWPPTAIPRRLAALCVVLPADVYRTIPEVASAADAAALLGHLPGWDPVIGGVVNPTFVIAENELVELVELQDCWLMPADLFVVRIQRYRVAVCQHGERRAAVARQAHMHACLYLSGASRRRARADGRRRPRDGRPREVAVWTSEAPGDGVGRAAAGPSLQQQEAHRAVSLVLTYCVSRRTVAGART